ncbi:MAG TPA: HD domain-containing protein [Thermodesulfobacteriota bacterium]|nr:HD domain-containing protein [Thermodesulfobacteriota bacterium]
MEAESLKKSGILQAVHRVSQKRKEEVYLVGGAIRDLLLGNSWGKDFDFMTKGEVSGLARDAARETGGHAFPLDETFGTWRVILKKRKSRTELDFSLLQGKDIFEDLRQRDFTINSIALRIEGILHGETPEFIDPLGGVSDLRRRILRANSEESLRQDPLRMLRAFRFASTLGFSVEDETLRMIERNKDQILRSAGERIRREFFTALDGNQAGRFLRQLNEVGLLAKIFPEIQGWNDLNIGIPDTSSLLEHAFRTVDAAEFILDHLDDLYPPFARSLDQHFSQEVEEGISRKALFKFLAFFHDSGKPDTMTWKEGESYPRFMDHDQAGQKINTAIASRMKLSRRSIKTVSNLTRHHMRIQSLFKVKEVTPRAKYRLFHDLGKEGIDLVFLALSSLLGSEKPEYSWPLSASQPGDRLRVEEIGGGVLEYYFQEFTQRVQKPLLDGKEIMEALGIPQGKGVGALLERLREAEFAGKVQTREEALKYLKTIDRFA